MKIDWSRFKNYGLWVSLFSLIAAGIISNPTTEAKGYLDDKKDEEEKQ